ncbi:GDYXXLXY domain-containing protein [Candidatus Woesearchaeota archaeon]|nr:GDYXXLXY domain-containing protein [Candidatus Woesearchaeota archaeon]
MEKKKLFLLIGLFWVIIIFGFVAFKEFTLQTGEEVLLKTRPIDPRDLFRGDYVILAYEISTLDVNSLQKDVADFKQDNKVYVSLNKVDNYGIPSGVYTNKPKEGLFLKGTVKNVQGGRLSMEYGIESYFVPEGRGREIERYSGRNLDVKVAIDKLGNAVIKGVLIDGDVLRFE